MKRHPLTPKQRRFVQELPLAPSQAEAARRAGYKDAGRAAAKVRGSTVVTNRNVRAALQRQLAKVERASIANQVERKETLTAILRDKLPGPYPVVAAIAASDQLNRMENLYVQKVDQRLVGDITIRLVSFGLPSENDEKARLSAPADEGEA